MPPEVPSPFKIRTCERFDGSRWRQYEFGDHIFILTSQGRALMAAGGLALLLRHYAEETIREDSSGKFRTFLTGGRNSRVFTVANSGLVVKEKSPEGEQLLPALERMDRLVDAVQRHCPRWIDIPDHYGVAIDKKDTRKQYLLIQKIDAGVTVGDVLNYHSSTTESIRAPHFREQARQMFGEITPELQLAVAERYKELRGELRHALQASYLSPDEYLPDIDHNTHNVVLEPLDTPIAGSSIKFWVIDQ